MTIFVFVYGINGISGEIASVVGRSGWEQHGMTLLLAARGPALGGTVAMRRGRPPEATI